MVDPPASRGGFFTRLIGLLWARGTILVVGLAVGLVIGLNLAPDATVSQSPAPPPPAPSVTAAQAAVMPHAAGSTAAAANTVALNAPVQPIALPGADRPLTVGVFGDSLGDGVWAALYRQLHAGKGLEVARLSQVSTGISRYNYVNIQDKTTIQLAAKHVDIAVVMFGANDQQGIVYGGQIYPFGSEGWKMAYGHRVDNLVATLRRQGAAVYWMGLPKMERARFDQGAVLINTLLQQHMAALGVTFVPTAPLTVDAQGQYAAYLDDNGTRRLMRASDGIHMSMAGYLRISAPVAALIRRDIAAARPPAPPPQAGLSEPVTTPASATLAASPSDSQP